MKSGDKDRFNFADAEPIIAAQLRIEVLPVGQIRVRGHGIYIPQWIINDPDRKDDAFNVHMDPAKKVLLLKPAGDGKHPFTRKTRIGTNRPGIFKSKRLFEAMFLGEVPDTSRTFRCEWGKEHGGYVVDLNAEIKPKESE